MSEAEAMADGQERMRKSALLDSLRSAIWKIRLFYCLAIVAFLTVISVFWAGWTQVYQTGWHFKLTGILTYIAGIVLAGVLYHFLDEEIRDAQSDADDFSAALKR